MAYQYIEDNGGGLYLFVCQTGTPWRLVSATWNMRGLARAPKCKTRCAPMQ